MVKETTAASRQVPEQRNTRMFPVVPLPERPWSFRNIDPLKPLPPRRICSQILRRFLLARPSLNPVPN